LRCEIDLYSARIPLPEFPSDRVDWTVAAMGLTVLKTPARSPRANAYCERVIGTIRRKCMDWMVLFNEGHLRRVLREWVAHYNRGRQRQRFSARTQ